MLLSILHRMILWELLKVFLLSLVAITAILLMAGIVAEASQQGLSPMQLLAIIPLLIPSTLPYTLPATTLFATCVVYGRLAADNEILAIKAAGVNILKVIWPGLFLGLVISCATMGLFYRAIPYTHLLMRTLFLDDIKGLLYGMLKRDKCLDHPHLDFIIHVRDVQGQKLVDATFQHRNKGEKHVHDFVITAREAELEVDVKDHKLIVKMYDGEVSNQGGAHGTFQYREEKLELPSFGDTQHIARPRDMSWKQLLRHRKFLRDKIAANNQEMEEPQDSLPGPDPASQRKKHRDNLKDAAAMYGLAILQIDTELRMRPALSFGCLCFVLIGCPVGIWFSRSDYLSAFITCFLPIVIVYYPLMLCGTNYAKLGRFNPTLTVWAADILVALIGIVLFGKLLRN